MTKDIASNEDITRIVDELCSIFGIAAKDVITIMIDPRFIRFDFTKRSLSSTFAAASEFNWIYTKEEK